MNFTMRYTPHPERPTGFTKTLQASGCLHALIPPGKPWRNGFIEGSNSTDKDELFNQIRFIDAEDRRYQLKLWEMDYNYHRPHQGIGNQIPYEVFCRDYPFHAACRCTT